MAGEKGDLEDNWRGQLSDDLKGDASLSVFEDVNGLAKAFVDIKSYQGASVHIPGEDAGEDAVKEFNDKLIEKVPGVMIRPNMDEAEQSRDFYRSAGMPEKPEGYDAPKIEGLPDGMKADDSRLEFLRGVGHKAGLSKNQFSVVMKAVVEADITAAATNKQTQADEMTALNKEWGAAADDYKKLARGIAEKTGAPEGMLKAFDNNALPADLVKWLHGLSVSIGSGEGNAHNNTERGGINGRMSPAEAKEKIDEIYANKGHAFHKGDKDAMKQMLELVGLANPEASKDVNDLRAGGAFGAN